MSQSRSARYHARRRHAALDMFGGACERCNVRSADLEIHHVAGDGHAERAAYGHAGFITRLLTNTRDPRFGPLEALCPPCHLEA